MRGPKPQPAKIVALKGNPGKRPLRNDAPGVGKIGDPPADMTEAARAKWIEAAEVWGLVLTGSDRDALRLYCEAWSDMVQAQARVEKETVMILTPNGMVQKSPWVTKIEQSREFCRRMAAEFGGTPSSRARVSVKGPSEQDNPADKYFA